MKCGPCGFEMELELVFVTGPVSDKRGAKSRLLTAD